MSHDILPTTTEPTETGGAAAGSPETHKSRRRHSLSGHSWTEHAWRSGKWAIESTIELTEADRRKLYAIGEGLQALRRGLDFEIRGESRLNAPAFLCLSVPLEMFMAWDIELHLDEPSQGGRFALKGGLS